MYILLLLLLLLVYRFLNEDLRGLKYGDRMVHPPDYPMLIEDDDFLPKTKCKEIATHLAKHKAMSMNGFCMKFCDDEKTKQNFIDHDLEDLYNIFIRVKEPKTNGFIANIVYFSPAKFAASGGQYMPGHYDGMIKKRDWLRRQYMPLCTYVVYINLQPEFTAGELFLKKYQEDEIYKKVKPKVGKMVRFRGDMFHGTEEIESEHNVDRFSIVFEQYIVPNPSKEFIVEDLWTEMNMTEDGLPMFG